MASLEAFELFYQASLKRFSGFENVKLYYGKSPEMLPIILLRMDYPSVIFLDAHPAGPGTAGHYDLMEKGAASEFNQDTIITKELKAILNHRVDHLIIIDDQNGGNEDNLTYRATLLEVNPNYKFYWFDEELEDGIHYKNKVLVCIPE